MAFRIWDSRPDTSYASSVGVEEASVTGGEESERAWALFALPDFFRRQGVVANALVVGRCREAAREKLALVSFIS